MTAQQLIASALQQHQRGQLADAEQIYRQVLAADPQNADALHLLGVIAHQVGRHAEAIALIGSAIEVRPQAHDFHVNLGEAHRAAGDPARAVASYQRAIQINPSVADDHVKLGLALAQAGRIDDAIIAYRRALEIRADDPGARLNLANALVAKGMPQAAEDELREAIRLRPSFAHAYNNLGDLYRDQGRLDEAIAALREAIRHNPQLPEPHNNLAAVLRARGQLDDAFDSLMTAIRLRPNYAAAYCSLAAVFNAMGRNAEAADAARQAIQLRPTFAEAYVNLASALTSLDHLDNAIAAAREAIRLAPTLAAGYVNLGNALRDTGAVADAIDAYRTAARIAPDDPRAGGNLVYTLLFDPVADARTVFEQTRQWSERYARPLAASIRAHDNDRSAARRLRIGYVSPDFRSHSSSYFVVPLLEAHDHDAIEVFCYSLAAAPDAMTDRIRSAADVWRDVSGTSDSELADLIRGDRIDIVIDLAMHLAKNRLLALARKPAPVQAAWLAYPGTTGLDAIDYRITDRHLDPPDRDLTLYSERCVMLPNSWACFDPLGVYPPVNETPAMHNGSLTFGSLNAYAKINDRVAELWARVVAEVPSSRLLLYSPPGEHRQRFIEHLMRAGVNAERVEFVGRHARAEYMQLYQRIDVCLDPFPHSGMTTTCEAVWMGVPVITSPGNMAPSRGALTFLRSAGLDELIARDHDDFVRLAAEVARDPEGLNRLRLGLRERLHSSPVMDAARFARNMERAYRMMWERHCHDEPPAHIAVE